MGFTPSAVNLGVMLFVMFNLIWANPMEGAAMGDQKARPVIVLACPQEVPEPQVLCQQMVQALSQAIPGVLVRRLQPEEEFQPRPEDLAVVLRLDALSEDHMGGHLEWRRGETAAPQHGPRVDIDVMDSTLSASFYARFVDGLVRVTPQIFAQ